MSFEELIVIAVEKAVERAFEKHSPRAEVQPELLRVPAAAKRTGLSADTIRRWIKEGRLKRYGSGRVVLVRLDELLSVCPDVDEGGAQTADDIVSGLLRGAR